MIGPRDPFGPDHYVPILRLAPAEIDGFADAVAHGGDEMTPIFRCEPKQFTQDVPDEFTRRGNPKRRARPATEDEKATVVAAAAEKLNAWSARYGGARCFIETTWIDVQYAGSHLPMLQRLLNPGRPFAPLVDFARIQDHASARAFAEANGAGVGLRVRLASDGFGGLDHPPEAAEVRRRCRVISERRRDVDLIIDAGYVDDAFAEATDELVTYIASLEPSRWRTVTLLGGSVPRIPNAAEGRTRLDRHEWTMFRGLRNDGRLATLTFGDYAIKHPELAIVPKGPQPYLVYTAEEFAWHFRRKRSEDVTSLQAYRRICRACTATPEWLGAGFSDGDARIAHYAQAADDERPGSAADWLRAMFGHHLTVVSRQTRGIPIR